MYAADDLMEVRGVQMRRDPAREACFKVVHSHAEMLVGSIDTPDAQREFLHRDVNNELQSLEIAAQSLIDFPDAPWALRMALARQAADEARHAWLCYGRMREMGGYKGEFPVHNHEWGIVCRIGTLAARLAIQNRIFEAGSLDVFRKMVGKWRDAGDQRTAEIMEAILNDEIAHVRYANEWLQKLIAAEPRVVMDIAAAIAQTRRIADALAPRPGETSLDGVALDSVVREITTSHEDRSLADFSDSEILELLRREERSLAATPTGTATPTGAAA
ncbi:MAG: DUF455 family protein [Burkholderiales bacterium]